MRNLTRSVKFLKYTSYRLLGTFMTDIIFLAISGLGRVNHEEYGFIPRTYMYVGVINFKIRVCNLPFFFLHYGSSLVLTKYIV